MTIDTNAVPSPGSPEAILTLDERIEAAKALTGYSEGPWEIVTDLPAIAIAAGKYRVVQTPNQNNYRHFGPSERWLGISDFDNAHLIAAAPDLHRLVLDLAAERERLRKIIADRCPLCRGTGIKGCSGGTGNAKTYIWKCDHEEKP